MLEINRPVNGVEYETIVFFMSPDPKPDDQFSFASRQGAIVRTNSNGPDVAQQRFELKRRVKGIAGPQPVFGASQFLDASWQFSEPIPESPVRL